MSLNEVERLSEVRKTGTLDQPFKLSLDFWAAYLLLGIPTLWITKPWAWNLPVISKAAGIVFFPFAAAIVCYCPVLLALAVIRGDSKEKKIAGEFAAAVAGATVFLAIVWARYGFDRVPSFLAIPAVLLANGILARFHARRRNS